MPGIGRQLERLLEKSPKGTYVLRLYVAGGTPQSTRAVANIKAICETCLKGRYELEVIDLYQRPELARGEQIIVAPTLVKKLPPPVRQLIGDMSETWRVLLALNLKQDRK